MFKTKNKQNIHKIACLLCLTKKRNLFNKIYKISLKFYIFGSLTRKKEKLKNRKKHGNFIY
ncbi:MAG: hypothetical protein CSA05_01705 [Bacteroidia bacterium]|nr:MAG: hypothetical protein CSA05_01705 [Bacteroidia bacterium]